MLLRKRPLKLMLWIGLLGLLTACQAFNREDTVGTLEAQNQIYSTEGIVIQTEALLARTQVQQTVQAAQTQVAQGDSINNQLLATVAAGSTPTIAIITAPRQDSTGQFTNLNPPVDNGTTQFVLTGVAGAVHGVDGCAANPQANYTTLIQRVYATLQAFNITSGTLMEAEWFRGNESVWTDSWTVDNDYDQICIWFFLLPSYVPFTEGVWSVQISADGNPIQQPMTFSFTAEMDDMMDDG